jgi:hypothetical protein
MDYLGLWRIHLTGTRLNFKTKSDWGSAHADYPDDPKQSNLYKWWQEQTINIGSLAETVNVLEETASELRAATSKPLPGLDRELLTRIETKLIEDAASLKRKLERFKKILESKRPEVSLERFDRWFSNFKTSQLIRLFLFELGLPCLLGGAAFVAIAIRYLQI